MTAATMQQTPVIPPRPSRGQDKDDSAASAPKIPPRPAAKRVINRSISPNPDRFAPSPLNDGIPQKSPRALHFSSNDAVDSQDPIDRSNSVAMPSVGEEGLEYSAMTEEFAAEKQEQERSSSPEQTRTVAEDLKLHAPKPSLPAQSAKQRVQTVTRTDSDKAAAFGIGRPASRDALKKKSSTAFSATESQPDVDDEGIPEIGQRVPMNPHLGDVQAPSPAPGSDEFKKHHHRKHSSRGGPPGSYGMHGHGVAPQDKLDKAYYEKNPHVFDREHKTPIHDRQNDFAMSRDDLNKLVRDTASRGSGLATSSEYHAAPTEEVGFQASEEYSRISSPLPASNGRDQASALSFKSEITSPDGEKTVHIDDPEHPQYRSPGDSDHAVDEEEQEYTAPILAPDEVGKDKSPYIQQPAVHPPERRRTSTEMEESHSRPNSRPTSIYKENPSQDFGSTPLDDVKEYEPLFPEEGKDEAQKAATSEAKARHYFPSKDVWEDAPNSVHYTAEVSTPDLTEKMRTLSSGVQDRPQTPAHAFAQKQEELAEREVNGPADVKTTTRSQEKPTWTEPETKSESFLTNKRPALNQRFPSRDIWEDVPESQLYEATVSASIEEESKPEIPSRPAKKITEPSERPAIPDRPKPKTPVDDTQKSRPPVSDKPKPQIPPRPSKSSSGDSKDGEFSKPKPPVPSRPVGGKIAALQAGFMSDLNKRLQLGPQAPKKEEPNPQEDLTEEKEKAPLADARKGRARGPQRRAPAKSPAAPEPAKTSGPTLTFSMPQTFWSIDPEQGNLAVVGEETPAPVVEEEVVEKTEEVPETLVSEEPAEEVEAETSEDSKPTPEEKTEAAEEKTEEPQEKTEALDEKTEALEEETEALEEETEALEEKTEALEEKTEALEERTEAPVEEEKTPVASMAASIPEASVEKKSGNEVEPVEVSEEVKA
ncbi:altered inheritance of mitochondria protein 21 [Ilyonectria robusta]|uniref:altered inheritance of mitochondria protein 21 n=1 Tax=Ilyonectria robusta TaxID=1079257 RepID=UPI001E8E6731|nr:altered inheritance of mitochondria protein 21 [Ilyonectria robusta]KAH8722094.1 altered inheritance of mitochondria protein 21 [Ilyonectria robusta]